MTAPDETGDHPQTSGGPAAPRRSRGVLLAWLISLAVVAYAADQLTKLWVTSTMQLYQVTEVFPPVLRWYYITNSGAAFSIGEGYAWIFAVVMAAVSVVIIYLARKVTSVWWAIALGMVLGGALGNLTDRLFRSPGFGMGHVVDFISFPNFAIFNMADSAVVGGVILICLLTLKGIPLNNRAVSRGSKAPRRTSSDEQTETDGS
ncbi:signal peptidase II [Psychromicrobium xiongbiense]|uniref:signal peptidase II n=1 Tax=Psychromicrobium xiongbiense TaxID=3051184 RepID=UPI0025559B89|nr:signal peptidase II [Psychromicrobium sp. YIM S02556]